MARMCIFCGADGPGELSGEHVNPAWLLDYLCLPSDDQLIQGVASPRTGRVLREPRVHSTHRFVLGRVCVGCNTGWMSRLEETAKPILILLMEQSREISSLSATEVALAAKWAAKTAYVHSWAGPLKRPVPAAHSRSLVGDAGQIAEGVAVYSMQADYRQPSGYIQSGTWPQLDRVHPIPEDAYKIGLHYRRLYFLVASWPTGEAPLVRVQGVHSQLLPFSNDPTPEYSVRLRIGDGPIDRLAAFADSLAVYSG